MPSYRKRSYKRSYGRSRSRSAPKRGRSMGNSFMKRQRTRAYANIRTGGLLAIERKFIDWGYTQTTIATAGSGVANNSQSTFAPAVVGPNVFRAATGKIFSGAVAPVALNCIGPGDTGSDRDGRQVVNDSIHIRGVVQYADGTTSNGVNASACVDIALVLDTQNNGSAPTGDLVFVNPGDFTGNGVASGTSAFVNLANSKRFRILKHIKRLLNPTSQVGTVAANQASGEFAFAMDVPLKQLKTNYVTDTLNTAGGVTSASIADNGIYLFCWTDYASSCNLTFNSRLRFRG